MPKIKELLNNWKNTVAALVALLILVPSVINGINDIWVAWRNLPIGNKEKINNQKFQEHHKENPIHTKQIIIEGKNEKVPITIDVYKNGDIFVDYGRLTQWFPYSSFVAKEDFHLVNLAYSGFFSKVTRSIKSPIEKSVKNVKKSDKTVERTRSFEDGSKEVQIININTGEIKSSKNIEPANSSNMVTPSISDSNSKIEVIKLPESSNDKVQIYEIEKGQTELKSQESDKKN